MTDAKKETNINISKSIVHADGNISIGHQNTTTSYNSDVPTQIDDFLHEIDSIRHALERMKIEQSKLVEITERLEQIKRESKSENINKKSLLEKVKLTFETITASIGATEAFQKVIPLLNSAYNKAVQFFAS